MLYVAIQTSHIRKPARPSRTRAGLGGHGGRARGDNNRRRIFSGWPDGTLREGMDEARARDTYAAVSNVDVYQVLTHERGWTPDQVEQWWAETLALLLLRS